MSYKRALSVQNLSKRYELGGAPKSETLAQAIGSRLRRPFAKAATEEFWALKDVSFDVGEGEVVGIIGRNGAGKSTLLKVLSRITEPTGGQIDLYGRVGSLLEVGTGFHPELSGRENIFLNGAILGMTRPEIRRQFDAIVSFAEVEQFLDTPVKRYSSGMYVRLAFAVAAHLNPEILIVDEVLAVGDAEFQKKCLGKMQDVAKGGRTVLFVSHHMQSVRLLCSRAVLLRGGTVAYDGSVSDAISQYLESYKASSGGQTPAEERPGTGEYRFEYVAPQTPVMESDGEKVFRWRVRHVKGEVGRFYLSAHVVNEHGVTLLQCDSRLVGGWWNDASCHEGVLRLKTPWLKPGNYRVDVALCSLGNMTDMYEGACYFDVSPVLPYPHSASSDGTAFGLMFADYAWDAAPRGETNAPSEGGH